MLFKASVHVVLPKISTTNELIEWTIGKEPKRAMLALVRRSGYVVNVLSDGF